jgi:hypothetical protein
MKRGRPRQSLKQPTTEQEAWIRKYYNNYTRKVLATKLKVGIRVLRAWLKDMNIEKKGPKAKGIPAPAPLFDPPAAKEIIRFEAPVKQPRPPAIYSNVSREQHIDRWLNTNI